MVIFITFVSLFHACLYLYSFMYACILCGGQRSLLPSGGFWSLNLDSQFCGKPLNPLSHLGSPGITYIPSTYTEQGMFHIAFEQTLKE